MNEAMNLYTKLKSPKCFWLSLYFPGVQWISRWIGTATMPFLLKGWWCHNLIMEKLLVIMLFGGLGRSPDVAFWFNKKLKAHSPDVHGLRSGVQHWSPPCPAQCRGPALPQQPSLGTQSLFHGWWRVDGGTMPCAAPLSYDLSWFAPLIVRIFPPQSLPPAWSCSPIQRK